MELNVLMPILAAFSTFVVGGMIFYASLGQQRLVHLKAQKLISAQHAKQIIKKKDGQNLSLKKQDIDAGIGIFRLMPSISKLRERLDRTGKDISIRQYYIWVIITFFISLLALKIIAGSKPLIALLLAIFFAIMIPHKIVNRWENQRMKKFLLLMPDALELMVRGLKAGLPVTESISVIKTEIEEPVKSVFGEIAASVKMGMNFEDSLLKMAKKLNINEFNFFVISVTLQRETGGNLSEILENLAHTIRARAMMKMKIKAITSEARMSAYIVGALPFFVTGALTLVSPDYLAPLFNDFRGNLGLAAAVCMFSFGMFIMFKMAKFEI